MSALAPALVPRPLWRGSAYKLLPSREWKAIRLDVLSRAADVCQVCGDTPGKGLTCHERWVYDDGEHVATLVGFECVCRRCSLVHHIGLASTGAIGTTAFADALARLASINGITAEEAQVVLAEALKLWNERSAVGWRQCVQPELVARYPVLGSIF
jgi:hypothetical protein